MYSALETAVSGDEVWVAQGQYLPVEGGDRQATFQLRSGVKIYGGFAGVETSVGQRDWDAHPTVLSGNIGDPGTAADNSLHVVSGYGLDSMTVLDGFTIADGYAAEEYGAGMQLECSSLLIINCLFTRNYAYAGGGAIFSSSGSGGCTTPRLRNCRFWRNEAVKWGGALYSACNTLPSDTLLIEHCVFEANKARTEVDSGGGAIHFDGGSTHSNTRLSGCVFDRDSAFLGGAVSAFASDMASYVLDSCFFFKNFALVGGGMHYFDHFDGPGHHVWFHINRCRFESNISKTDSGAAYFVDVSDEAYAEVTIRGCDFIGNLANSTSCAYIGGEKGSEVKVIAEYSRFIRNKGYGIACFLGGGANNGNRSEMYLSNCLFAHNGRGIVSTTPTEGNYAATEVRNCTFFNNGSLTFVKHHLPGHEPYYLNQADTFYNKMWIENCIIWEPRSNGDDMFYNGNPTLTPQYIPTGWGFTVRNSSISLPPFVLLPTALQGTFDSILYVQYPYFLDTLADDFHLPPCTPMINRGSNAAAGGMTRDLDGLPRIADGRVDLGAYEQQQLCMVDAVSSGSEWLPLTISPNPSADGRCTITNVPAGYLTVCYSNGAVRHRQYLHSPSPSLSLDFRDFQSGVYLIYIDSASGRYAGKWVYGR